MPPRSERVIVSVRTHDVSDVNPAGCGTLPWRPHKLKMNQTMAREYYVVDAFTSEPFAGNAAGVVLDAGGLSDDEMLNIAAEFNLSETTFVLPPSNPEERKKVRFRWCTPAAEVDMCGHATIAGAFALAQSGRFTEYGLADPKLGPVAWPIETRSGVLTVFIEPIPGRRGESMLWLDLVDPVLSPALIAKVELTSLLNIDEGAYDPEVAPELSQDGDLIVFLRDVATLNDCRPDFGALGQWCERTRIRGLSLATVHTLAESIHVQSRFFAPAVGVNEDPVTGSVHGPLAAKVVALGIGLPSDDITALTCVQGIPGGRTGLLHALVQRQGESSFAVRIGGRATITMHGTLQV